MDASATFATRKLLSATGTEVIDYSIYTDDTHTTVWGDGSAGTSTVSGTGVLGTKSHTVYGRMPAGQSANQGIYADIINVTLTY